MATFGVTVDTTPMAQQMHGISQNVDKTTGAVVLMKNMLVQVEKETNEYLCQNVNSGFYDLIISQIAQKSALAQSEMKAFVLEMVKQTKDLQQLEVRMGRDYAMITKRNVNLFNGLNKELENRIAALDKPLLDLVRKDVKRVDSRVIEHIAAVPVNQSESLSVSQTIAAARLKAMVDGLIKAMTTHISNENAQSAQLAKVMDKKSVTDRQVQYVPVVYITTNDAQDGLSEEYYMPDDLSEQQLDAMEDAVGEAMDTFVWQDAGRELREVLRREMDALIDEEQVDARVADTMRRLFDSSEWKTLNR